MAFTVRTCSSRDRLKGMALIALMVVLTMGLASQGWSKTYYVSTGGNDSHDGLAPAYVGGSNGPFRTFQRAAYAVRAGDNVQIRGGTYEHGGSWGYSHSGTQANPIVVTAYPGETVVVDGANHTRPSGAYSPLMQIHGDWYVISQIELRYGSYAGLNIIGDHNTVRNLYFHHNKGAGAFASGMYNTIENCRAYYNSMANRYGVMKNGWDFGISLCANARYSTVRGCTAWHNWGEGISIASGYYCTIEDCVSYDNFSVNIYLCQSLGGVVQRNLSYYTPGNPLQAYTSSQNGIYAGDEGNAPASSGNKIINNLCRGGDRCLLVSGDDLDHTLVAHNTFANAFRRVSERDGACVYFLSGASTGGRFVNNIIYQEDSFPISHYEAAGISFDHNNWSRLPVAGVRGTGDVNADPQLSRSGSVLAGELGPGWFNITDGSPARGKAVPLSQVTEDFWRAPRGSAPDMGAFNIGGGPSVLTASASGAPTSGHSPLTVNFTGRAFGGTSPYAYQWAFGDGATSTDQNPVHVYASSGRYTATLTAIDDTRTTATATVAVAVDATITTILQAHATASVTTGQAPLAVNFVGSASGGSEPYTYQWTFGDGGTSTSQNPVRVYASPGTYAVKLTVKDRTATTATWDLIIRATSLTTVLSANGLASPSTGKAPLAVRFVASAAGGSSPYTYHWSFGDGTTSSSQSPSHTFSSPGTYNVVLTVRDGLATTTTTRLAVKVLPSTAETVRRPKLRDRIQPKIILR